MYESIVSFSFLCLEHNDMQQPVPTLIFSNNQLNQNDMSAFSHDQKQTAKTLVIFNLHVACHAISIRIHKHSTPSLHATAAATGLLLFLSRGICRQAATFASAYVHDTRWKEDEERMLNIMLHNIYM